MAEDTLEEEEKTITNQLKEELLRLPNIPHKNCPNGKDEKEIKEKIKTINSSLQHRFEYEQCSIFFVNQNVKPAVWTLLNIRNSRFELS